MGLAGGIALGMIIAVAMELSQQVVRNEADIRDVMHLATLAMIPVLDGTEGSRRKSSRPPEVQHV